MNEHEGLIEEAAKVIFEVGIEPWRPTWEETDAQGIYRERARAALAVFEKAHTPTSDEHLDIEEIGIAAEIHTRYLRGEFDGENHKPGDAMRLAVLEGVRAGFRRSEAPEPISDDGEFAPGECDGSGACAASMHVHGCYTLHRSDECDSPTEYGHLR